MTTLPIIVDQNPEQSGMLPNANALMKGSVSSIVDIEVQALKQSLSPLLVGVEELCSEISAHTSRAQKVTVAIDVMKDGKLGIAGFASAGSRVRSSFSIEFLLNE